MYHVLSVLRSSFLSRGVDSLSPPFEVFCVTLFPSSVYLLSPAGTTFPKSRFSPLSLVPKTTLVLGADGPGLPFSLFSCSCAHCPTLPSRLLCLWAGCHALLPSPASASMHLRGVADLPSLPECHSGHVQGDPPHPLSAELTLPGSAELRWLSLLEDRAWASRGFSLSSRRSLVLPCLKPSACFCMWLFVQHSARFVPPSAKNATASSA